jgi:opacity protein-like surface antigen
MKRQLILAVLVLTPWFAQADGFDYTFVDGGIANTDVDLGPLDVDADGFTVGASFAINDDLHAFGSYEDQDFDFGVNGSVFELGAGFHTGISDDLDFVADLAYLDAEIATPIGSADESGYAVGGGIRTRLSDAFELDAGLRYVDLDDSDTLIRVGGRYYFNPSFAVGGAYTDGDNGSTWSMLVRYNFRAR